MKKVRKWLPRDTVGRRLSLGVWLALQALLERSSTLVILEPGARRGLRRIKIHPLGSSRRGSVETNLIRIHEDTGLIPGWGSSVAVSCGVISQTWLGSRVAVAVV